MKTTAAVHETDFSGLNLLKRGKVRDLYDLKYREALSMLTGKLDAI